MRISHPIRKIDEKAHKQKHAKSSKGANRLARRSFCRRSITRMTFNRAMLSVITFISTKVGEDQP
jgi:hypothetical protein